VVHRLYYHGEDHADLTTALEDLYSRYVIKAVRVDSGGTLNGLFLRQGLVSEVSILIYPSLVRGETTSSIFRVLELATAPIAYLSASLGTEHSDS
jgi:2,5-diamino-6-(ribosylamino)-4(3H)-pyrimidinone 5'-phosphate reductase